MNIDDVFGRGHDYINDSWVRPFSTEAQIGLAYVVDK